MSLISILLVLIVTISLLIHTYVPMDTTIKNVFNSLIIIVTIIWVLNAQFIVIKSSKQMPNLKIQQLGIGGLTILFMNTAGGNQDIKSLIINL
jgi:hypothetical protein